MKYLKMLAIVGAALGCQAARADTSYDFVRIACIPATGMLDVEYRLLHDTVVGKTPAGQAARNSALARHGFHEPSGLRFRCSLNGAKYLVSAEQGPGSTGRCGARPDITLSVSRNGVPMFKDVTFGDSCDQLPSVRRFVLAEPTTRGQREANICYASGELDAPEQCQWMSEDIGDEFGKAFPIDQDAVDRYLKSQKK